MGNFQPVYQPDERNTKVFSLSNVNRSEFWNSSLNPSYICFFLLQKWLEVSSRRRSGPPCCELCQYQYLRHKKFVVSFCFSEMSLDCFAICPGSSIAMHCYLKKWSFYTNHSMVKGNLNKAEKRRPKLIHTAWKLGL